ncbi:hypothetical protein C8R44DRAFT_748264 [Mycena epipterygia]|nr:hypothetical protein C8R44DRAFT_748264 [Mycena epipterygia]
MEHMTISYPFEPEDGHLHFRGGRTLVSGRNNAISVPAYSRDNFWYRGTGDPVIYDLQLIPPPALGYPWSDWGKNRAFLLEIEESSDVGHGLETAGAAPTIWKSRADCPKRGVHLRRTEDLNPPSKRAISIDACVRPSLFQPKSRGRDGPNSISTVDNKKHAEIRRAESRAYSGNRLTALEQRVDSCCNDLLAHLDRCIDAGNGTVDISQIIHMFATDVIGDLAVGLKFPRSILEMTDLIARKIIRILRYRAGYSQPLANAREIPSVCLF